MDDQGLSAAELATALNVPTALITGILEGERQITAETAVQLTRCIGMSKGFWMNLRRNFGNV